MRSEIRDFRDANNRTLNAMREEMGGLRGDLNDLRSHVDNGFAEMHGKFDTTAAGLEQISGLLTTLIAGDGQGTP